MNSSGDMENHKKMATKFFDEQIGHTFRHLEKWPTISGDKIDLVKAKRPTVLYLGFAGCQPCRASMPTFIKMSQYGDYGNCDFIYMTYDGVDIIKEEFEKFGDSANRIKFVSVPKQFINARHLADYGYPAMYLIDASNILRLVHTLGHNQGNLNKEETWEKMLKSITM